MPSRRTLIAAAVSAPWVLWAAVRALGLDTRHPLVAAMAFTPYAAATSVVPVALALVLRRWVVGAVAAAAACALALAVVLRLVDGEAAASGDDGGPTLTVMTSNVYFGKADPRAVLRLVAEHGVDVLSLQELTPEAVRRLDAAGARGLLPERAVEARPGAAGSGLMARVPLRTIAYGNPWGAAQPEAEVAVLGAAPVRVRAVHPYPPVSTRNEALWQAEMRELPGPRAAGGAPRILAGDFNATLDHAEFRRLLDLGYADAADAVGAGLTPTWPSSLRRGLPITIDHVLVPPGVRVRSVSVHRVPGSDHKAVIADLVLEAR